MSRNKRKKKQSERKNATNLLREWQRERLERDRELPLPPPGPSEVTLVAYFLPPPSGDAEALSWFECAVRESWRHCGVLRTVLVAPEATDALKAFAAPFGPRVEIQVEPSLVPGRPETAAVDRAARLARRFETRWALVVADDAFPLRPGIGTWIDRWDFAGAPRPRSGSIWERVRSLAFNCHPMDGAFSFRTRALCERAASEWAASRGVASEDFSDGAFCTETLPLRSFSWRRSFRFPRAAEALRFSRDDGASVSPSNLPFGFSGAEAFQAILRSGAL